MHRFSDCGELAEIQGNDNNHLLPAAALLATLTTLSGRVDRVA